MNTTNDALVTLRHHVGGEVLGAQLRKVLPDHISVDAFQRTVLTAINNNQDLIDADRTSLLTACVECAQDGLLPNGREAALVVFNTKQNGSWIKKAQYMPMIAGIFKRLRNSGDVRTIASHLIHANDLFEYSLGFEPSLIHKPALTDRGAVLAVYAVAVMTDGSRELEIMTREDVEEVRKSSKSKKDDSPWIKHWGEMARKSVLRRLAKRLPLSADTSRVVERTDRDDGFRQIEHEAAPALPRPSRHDPPPAQIDAPGFYAPDDANPFPFYDAWGNGPEDYDRAQFVETLASALLNAGSRDEIDALMEGNADAIERLGDPRQSTDRQSIHKTMHEAIERLGPPEQPEPPEPQEPQEPQTPGPPPAPARDSHGDVIAF